MPDIKTAFIFGFASVALACGSSDGQPSVPADAGGGSSNAGATNTAAGTSGSAGSLSVGGSGASGAGGSGNSSGGGATGNAGAGGIAGSGGMGGGSGGGTDVGCTPPADVFSPIAQLSQTGCMDPANPTKPTPRAFAYEVNSPLWSDAADKTRAFVVPAGAKIHVRDCTKPSDCPNGNADEGRWDFPVGSVMIKNFFFDKKILETRLFMHLDAQNWVGYSYQWNEAQTEATIVSADGAQVSFNTGMRTVAWHYPSQMDCMNCHNAAGGSTLGPETAQFNRVVGGSNQIDKIAALGLFETAPKQPLKAALVAPYASESGNPSGTPEQQARSYLHANCGFCHRPGGNYPNFDYRYDTPFKDMNLCNADAKKGPIANGMGKTKILVPGKATDSVMWQRMNEPDPQKGRMPQIGSFVTDHSGTTVVGDWINSLPTTCP